MAIVHEFKSVSEWIDAMHRHDCGAKKFLVSDSAANRIHQYCCENCATWFAISADFVSGTSCSFKEREQLEKIISALPSSLELKIAYELGETARMSGRYPVHCPHPDFEAGLKKAWNKGWMAQANKEADVSKGKSLTMLAKEYLKEGQFAGNEKALLGFAKWAESHVR